MKKTQIELEMAENFKTVIVETFSTKFFSRIFLSEILKTYHNSGLLYEHCRLM